MSVLELAKELQRQSLTSDSKFLRGYVYFFELRVPPSVAKGSTTTYIYPLIIAPESYRMSEPFQVSKTFTNGSGLWVEEDGIIARTITLRGTTGFKPRRFPKIVTPSTASGVALPYEGKSHSRNIAFNIVEALSGQRHFQFLQDAVFRTYGDLKRDPATAEGTELYFHNVKDDEHWRVVPMRFDTDKSARRGQLYAYDIELLAVAPGTATAVTFSEDQDLLKTLNDSIRMVRFGVSQVSSAILDLAKVQNELRLTIKNIGNVIDDVGGIATATEAFLDGTTRLIAVPLDYLSSTRSALEAALSAFDKALTLGSGEDVPDSVLNILRRIGDGLAVIMSYPTLFQNSIDDAVASFQKKADLSTARSQVQLEQARAADAPSTLRGFKQHGTQLLPGDWLRSREELGLGRKIPRFTSAEERIIEHGDSLPTLAARFLGDARQWKYLAVFNDLQPPFISAERLPGTLTVGDKILIPTFAKPQGENGPVVTLGVRPEAPAAEHALGVDVLVADQGKGLFDLVVDDEHGSTDIKVVRAVENLKQGLTTRIITERGSDMLYKTLGMDRVVGLGLTEVDREVAQIRMVETVQADPRIAGVRNLTFQNTPDDALQADIDAEVRGIARPEKVIVRSS